MPAPDATVVDPSTRAAFELYVRRTSAARAEERALDRTSARLANLRALAFFLALGLGVAALFNKLPGYGGPLAVLCLAIYVALAAVHERVLRREARARLRAELNERGRARLDGTWRQFPHRGERYLDPGHLNAPDLDLFGQGSLFQLLDETATVAGEAKLASWLLSPAPVAAVLERQAAVKELAPLLDFRQSVVAESRLAAQTKADPSRLLAWAEGAPLLEKIRWARPLAFGLPPVTLALYLLYRSDVLSGLWFVLALGAQVAVVAVTYRALALVYERISMGESGVVRFEETFLAIERQPLGHPVLSALQRGLAAEGPAVSERMRRFSRLFAFAEVRQSGQFHAVLNVLLLWDVQWLFRLEDWRRAHGPHLRGWFEALAEVEALSSLAGFAHDRPHFSFPQLEPSGALLQAEALGHPLLDRPVRNDVDLAGRAKALIITGSNMAGKTTLLRALGINAVMALAGLPVCARSLRLGCRRVLTSMRVKDSLEQGVSYFYAEVKRIKAVLDAAIEARGEALFLLDELLLGTNARERQLASRDLVRLLVDTGARGAITTHDLTLAELEGEPALEVRNVHFRDQLLDGAMTFDYRLRDGVVDTTNALRVLRLAGVPIREEAAR